jgi:hypothetical protein
MEKCWGYGKSEKVMIWLRMGYDFFLEVEIIFPLFRGTSPEMFMVPLTTNNERRL